MAERLAVAGGAVRRALALVAGCVVALGLAAPAGAQEAERCVILCAPELKIEPTITFENLLERPRIHDLETGAIFEEERETVLELIFAVDIPTQFPRIGVTLEAIFVPFGETDQHPFTGVTAEELGEENIRDNGVEIESELNIVLFEEDRTGGWLSSHFDIVDKFSPGETPRAQSVYTHKLNFEWDTALHPFNRLPESSWLRNLEAELSVDYVATGLPKAGDVIGDELFLDDASPWSLSLVLVMPLAPLVP